MKHAARLKRWTLSLTSLTLLSCSLGCVAHAPPAPRADWVKPIYMEDDAAEWLHSIPDWPDSFVRFLNDVHRHNLKTQEINSP